MAMQLTHVTSVSHELHYFVVHKRFLCGNQVPQCHGFKTILRYLDKPQLTLTMHPLFCSHRTRYIHCSSSGILLIPS